MSLNIGEKIKHRDKELRIGPAELSLMINTSKQNIYSIYKRKSIDVETLRKLSVALKYDFFDYYKTPKVDVTVTDILDKDAPEKNIMVPYSDYVILKSDYEHLKEKYELLKKINLLLEDKIKKTKIK